MDKRSSQLEVALKRLRDSRVGGRKKANKNESKKAGIKTTHTNTDKITDEEAQHEKEKKGCTERKRCKGRCDV